MKKSFVFLLVFLFSSLSFSRELPPPRTIYMIELDIRNSSFSLSIGKHLRNAMNAVQLEIPVDKDFWEELEEGQELKKSFKTASFFMKGSITFVKIKCTRKWTVYY